MAAKPSNRSRSFDSDLLSRKHGYLLEHLEDGPRRDRVRYFEIMIPDILERLDQLANDTAPPLPPADAVREAYPDLDAFVLGVLRGVRKRYGSAEIARDGDAIPHDLLGVLRTVCEKHGCEGIAHEVATILDDLHESAHHGQTRGQQRASIYYRHPDAIPFAGASPTLEIERDYDREEERSLSDAELQSVPIDGRKRRSDHRLFTALRICREFQDIHEHVRKILGPKGKRRGRAQEIRAELLAAYPELGDRLERSMELTLSPRDGACLVYKAKRYQHLSPTRVRDLVAEARDVVAYNERYSTAIDSDSRDSE